MELSLFLAAGAAIALGLLRRLEGGPAAGLLRMGGEALTVLALWHWSGGRTWVLALPALAADGLLLFCRTGDDSPAGLTGGMLSALVLATAAGREELAPYLLGMGAAGVLSALAAPLPAGREKGISLGTTLLTAAAFLLGGLLPEPDGLLSAAAAVLGMGAGLLLGWLARRFGPPGRMGLLLPVFGPLPVLGGTIRLACALEGISGIALAEMGALGAGLLLTVPGPEREERLSHAGASSGALALSLPALFSATAAKAGGTALRLPVLWGLTGLGLPLLLLGLFCVPAPAGKEDCLPLQRLLPAITAILVVPAVGLPLGKAALLGFLAGAAAGGSLLAVTAEGLLRLRRSGEPEAADSRGTSAGATLGLLLRMTLLTGLLMLPILK